MKYQRWLSGIQLVNTLLYLSLSIFANGFFVLIHQTNKKYTYFCLVVVNPVTLIPKCSKSRLLQTQRLTVSEVISFYAWCRENRAVDYSHKYIYTYMLQVSIWRL